MIVRLQDEVETLSNQSTFLQQETLKLREQIKVVRKHHHDVISVYRTHLLRAAQGTMDDEVHSMLLHIYSMQRQAVC
ncbi:UACA protein, partial [Amia calva]|nr:UACA protein [Amia calva]